MCLFSHVIDVLDEFQATTISSSSATASGSATAPTASGPGRPSSSSHGDTTTVEPDEEELAKQLQAGISGLISDLDSNPDMKQRFEQMMSELIAVGSAPSDREAGEHLKQAAAAVPPLPASSGDRPNLSGVGKKEDFGSTIRKTMERMQASDSAATSSTAVPQSEEDMIAQMLKDLQQGGGDGEEDFNSLLLSMMSQLTHKEILYEPMKELNDKFPNWMEKNQGKVDAADMKRYKEQQVLVSEIVGRFEKKDYSDESEGDREYIVERMQKV